ncbi:MAG: guanylate kinase [Synergistaceae bacterium]|nr:guanylate kinase [Synergistaceae bacterium]
MGKTPPRGRLFVLAGPSGVGKGTLRQSISDIGGLEYSVSCTTRAPRDGERDGVDYRFVTREDFLDKVRRGLFLEYAVVHGEYYGTLRGDVERNTAAGKDVLLEIDVQGASSVHATKPDSVLIFVMPPSMDVLGQRLRRRGTDSEQSIATRLENAKKEVQHAAEYDHVIVNNVLEDASKELREVILSYRREK